MVNILITGGCGFIGTNLLDFLLKKGFIHFHILDDLSVGKIDNLEDVLTEHARFDKTEENNKIIYTFASRKSPRNISKVELFVGDIRNRKDCKRAAKGVTAVVHLAAQSGVPTSVENPLLDCEINIIGTINILETCRENGIESVVFASSGAPLGEVEPPINEQKVARPVSPYGASKLAGEAYCSAYHKTFGIKTVALRFGNVYGPRSNHKSSVVAKFIKRALDGLPIEVYGDGAQTRDFIFVNDICNAIYLALSSLELTHGESEDTAYTNSSVSAGEIFQIATFKETTVSEIAEKIKILVEKETREKVDIVHAEKRIGDVQRNYSDISKARSILGFNPLYDLDEGLLLTWKDFLPEFCK